MEKQTILETITLIHRQMADIRHGKSDLKTKASRIRTLNTWLGFCKDRLEFLQFCEN